jgi:predicted nuclease of predicted toxin-antitoxin system
MKIKLLLDEDVHLAVAVALRKRGYDVVHVQELDRKGKTDPEQLRYAVEQERCMVSFNMKDFVLLHNHYVQNVQSHFGIIVSKQIPVGTTIHELLKVLQHFSQNSIKNQIQFL